MNNLKIIIESLPTRCEICHQSDLFDSEANLCSRCQNIQIDEDLSFSKKRRPLDYGDIGLITGAIGGALIGVISEIVKGLSLAHISSYPVIIGLVIVGAIFGTISGEGIERLYKLQL